MTGSRCLSECVDGRGIATATSVVSDALRGGGKPRKNAWRISMVFLVEGRPNIVEATEGKGEGARPAISTARPIAKGRDGRFGAVGLPSCQYGAVSSFSTTVAAFPPLIESVSCDDPGRHFGCPTNSRMQQDHPGGGWSCRVSWNAKTQQLPWKTTTQPVLARKGGQVHWIGRLDPLRSFSLC
jgi:hypothetical protein